MIETLPAPTAAAARQQRGHGDTVVHRPAVHARAKLDDRTGKLVANRDGHPVRPALHHARQVGAADPYGAHTQQDLARLSSGNGNVVDGEFANAMETYGFHVGAPAFNSAGLCVDISILHLRPTK